MITEITIDEIVEKYQSDDSTYAADLAWMVEEYPVLLAYLSQESNDLLTEEEKDILWYIVLVVIISIENQEIEKITLDEEKLQENEDRNWEVYQEQKEKDFRDRITVFFDEYAEEDLLAFTEDVLEIDDESPISSIGREVIFINVKSIIDTAFVI